MGETWGQEKGGGHREVAFEQAGEWLDRISHLFENQQQGVLVTVRECQPYCSLMAFVGAKDLKSIYLATPKGTRKHDNILTNNRVSFLVDNRENKASDTAEAMAVTVMGQAEELAGDEREEAGARFARKYPSLKDFVRDNNTALVRMRTERFVCVRRFQEVMDVVISSVPRL